MSIPEFPASRTAIVTGGGRRIGAAISRVLAEDGWTLLIHCRESVAAADAIAASVPGSRVVRVDLADAAAPDAIVAALDGMPPPALLVNNASRFVYDSFDDFGLDGWAAHMDVNFRAPALLTQAFARAVPAGQAALVVNLLDAKLGALNPDFFTYTLSKLGFAGLTELAARVLGPRGIRVCGIAPSVTLVSGPQTRENFDEVHKRNALGRGVTVDQIVAALRYVISAPTLTGQTITLDAGQRFLGLPRDVQYMEFE